MYCIYSVANKESYIHTRCVMCSLLLILPTYIRMYKRTDRCTYIRLSTVAYPTVLKWKDPRSQERKKVPDRWIDKKINDRASQPDHRDLKECKFYNNNKSRMANLVFSILWLVLLVFIVWPIAAFLAG